MLERPRHQAMIDEIRAAGAMVRLFSDGDVNFALATCKEDSGVDLFMSTGGAPGGGPRSRGDALPWWRFSWAYGVA